MRPSDDGYCDHCEVFCEMCECPGGPVALSDEEWYLHCLACDGPCTDEDDDD